jgi:hemin uptake protein HemP
MAGLRGPETGRRLAELVVCEVDYPGNLVEVNQLLTLSLKIIKNSFNRFNGAPELHMEPTDPKPVEPDVQKRPLPLSAAPVVSSETLMQGGNELVIAHRGDVYRLRVTRSGKLILQK